MRIVKVEKDKASKIEWQHAKDIVIESLKDETLCKGLVTSTYIQGESFDNANIIIIGFVPKEIIRRKTVEGVGGFILANEISHPGFLYIDVVCSNYPKLGETLIQIIEKLAQQKKLHGVSLSSLAHVIGYYRRLGYYNRTDCFPEDREVTMKFEENVKPLIEKHKQNIVDHILEPPYREFLQFLINRDLAKDKMCKKSKNAISECNIHGYTMTKCFSEKKQLKGTTPSQSKRVSSLKSGLSTTPKNKSKRTTTRKKSNK